MEVLTALVHLAALSLAGCLALKLVIRYVLIALLDRLIAQTPDTDMRERGQGSREG